MNVMQAIRNATLAARERCNDKRIGTSVANGRLRVERVTYAKNGCSTVEPLSGWLPINEAIAFLNGFTA